jgi:F-type H+-transporting ATPase subunit a
VKILAKLILLSFTCTMAHGADDGVKVFADKVFTIGSFPVTNSMVTSWVISLALILLIKVLVGRPQLIPSKGQLVLESVIGGIRTIIEPIVGKKVFFPSFWLLSGLFFFILIHNWSGLLPGVGTIGYGYEINDHFSVKKPLIRPGNADLNMTLALALVANLFWIYFIVKFAGIKAIIKDWFGNKAEKSEVSSLTFRLFGNVFGGESLLHSMFYLVPQLKWILPVPFYFMEVLIGLVQALVFMLLVSVYIGLICNHDEGDNH